MVDMKALIAQHKANLSEAKPVIVNVEIAGELVEVGITPILGDGWQDLAGRFPPRSKTTDDSLGFNQKDLPSEYPVAHLTVAGESVDAETWAEFYGVLASPSRNSLVSVMWGVNVLDPMNLLKALGKAKAGGSSDSPANLASRRAASKGGSRPKSPSSSTTKKAE